MKRKMWIFVLALIGVSSILIISCNKNDEDDNDPNTLKDIDGNVYTTVTIGTQVWMVENLRTTKYRNGTPIAHPGTNINEWRNNISGAYAWYDNDEITYKNPYGALYNWYAVKNPAGLCPAGWSVPIKEDWETLTNYLGGDVVAGGKLKERGTTHWESPNTGATNESGFTGLPGGIRIGFLDNWGGENCGVFSGMSRFGIYWSSTGTGEHNIWHFYTFNDESESGLDDDEISETFGLTVRCIKD